MSTYTEVTNFEKTVRFLAHPVVILIYIDKIVPLLEAKLIVHMDKG